MVYVLAAYMRTVVCASFALICQCLVVRVKQSRDIKRQYTGITQSVEIIFSLTIDVRLYSQALILLSICTREQPLQQRPYEYPQIMLCNLLPSSQVNFSCSSRGNPCSIGTKCISSQGEWKCLSALGYYFFGTKTCKNMHCRQKHYNLILSLPTATELESIEMF